MRAWPVITAVTDFLPLCLFSPPPWHHISLLSPLSLCSSQWTSPRPRAQPPPPSPRCPPRAPPGGLTTVTLSRGVLHSHQGHPWVMSHFLFQEALVSRVLRLLSASWLPRSPARHGQRSSKGGENILQNGMVKIMFFNIFQGTAYTFHSVSPKNTLQSENSDVLNQVCF